MIIKSFKAKSASDAMKQIRREMGDEAIVLKTQQTQNQVEITACIENATVSKADEILRKRPESDFSDDLTPEIKVEKNRLEDHQPIEEKQSEQTQPEQTQPEQTQPEQTQSEQTQSEVVQPIELAESEQQSNQIDNNTIDENNNTTGTKTVVMSSEFNPGNTILSEMNEKLNKLLSLNLHCDNDTSYSDQLKPFVAQMQRADLPADFIYNFFLHRSEMIANKKDIKKYIIDELSKVLAKTISSEIKIRKGDGVLVYGPAGSGKSSLLGKLAVLLLAKKKKRVKLASLDDQKIGAYEELAVYADLLKLETVNSKSSDEENKNDHITLIDTPAYPKDIEQQNELCDTVNRINPEYRIAVISALTRTDDVLEISEQLSNLNPTHLAVTMLDLTNRLGGIIAATRVLNTKLLFVTDAPGGVKQIMTPTPQQLAKTIMGTEVSYE